MLATRNFSGRWWDLRVQIFPAQVCWVHCPVRYLGAFRPGDLGKVGAAGDPETGGFTPVEKWREVRGQQAKGPLGRAEV